MGQEPLGALKNLFDFCRAALDATADAQQRAMGSCTSLCLGSSAANANANARALSAPAFRESSRALVQFILPTSPSKHVTAPLAVPMVRGVSSSYLRQLLAVRFLFLQNAFAGHTPGRLT